MYSATLATGPGENAVDVAHAPASSNHATASGLCPPSAIAERGFSENAITCGDGLSCARISSASVVNCIRAALSPIDVSGLP